MFLSTDQKRMRYNKKPKLQHFDEYLKTRQRNTSSTPKLCG